MCHNSERLLALFCQGYLPPPATIKWISERTTSCCIGSTKDQSYCAVSYCFEVLIQWEEMSQENATWENGLHIIEQFPDFLLEDKGIFWGRVVIGPQLLGGIGEERGGGGKM